MQFIGQFVLAGKTVPELALGGVTVGVEEARAGLWFWAGWSYKSVKV